MDKTLRNSIAIVGVGESDIGKVPNRTGLGLNAQASKRTLAQTGLRPSDIDGLLTAYSWTESYFMLGSVMCEYLGLKPRYNASMFVGGCSPAVMLKHAAEAIQAGQAAYKMAGLGPNDMDFAQLYDCFSIVPMMELEELGFCEPGESGPFCQAGQAADQHAWRDAFARTCRRRRRLAGHRRSGQPAARMPTAPPGGGRRRGIGSQ